MALSVFSTGIHAGRILPKSIFTGIIGYELEKHLFSAALASPSPVHILLCGPPGCGKTEFLKKIQKANLQNSHFVLDATKAGLLEALFVKQPKYLLVDEIEHLKKHDVVTILSLMEGGIISETKFGKTREMQLKSWVFATCNDKSGLPPALISRFYVMDLPHYTKSQYQEIVLQVLPARTRVTEDTALFIAETLFNKTEIPNLRDSLKIAKLAGNDRKAIEIAINRMAH